LRGVWRRCWIGWGRLMVLCEFMYFVVGWYFVSMSNADGSITLGGKIVKLN
jgi:hypothetical protein